MYKSKVIISAGGTGGHIYPAIAIANELNNRFNADILFVGALDRMEMEQVPLHGYPIVGIRISGLQRKLSYKNLFLPFKVLFGLIKARKIIKSFSPDMVIGTGGYASMLVVYQAARNKIPCFIQEQNSYPGITNKFLSKYAKKVFVAHEHMHRFFSRHKIVNLGNPVREDLMNMADKRQEGLAAYKLKDNKKVLLVLGGSLGAGAINKIIEQCLPFFSTAGIQLIWQCGKSYAKQYDKYSHHDFVRIKPFIERVDLAYAAADIILSRSGAGAISELLIVAKPLILVPSPNVAENHQYKNAQVIEERQGAKVFEEKELIDDLETFQSYIMTLLEDTTLQKSMSEALKKMAKPNATRDIISYIEKELLGEL